MLQLQDYRIEIRWRVKYILNWSSRKGECCVKRGKWISYCFQMRQNCDDKYDDQQKAKIRVVLCVELKSVELKS